MLWSPTWKWWICTRISFRAFCISDNIHHRCCHTAYHSFDTCAIRQSSHAMHALSHTSTLTQFMLFTQPAVGLNQVEVEVRAPGAGRSGAFLSWVSLVISSTNKHDVWTMIFCELALPSPCTTPNIILLRMTQLLLLEFWRFTTQTKLCLIDLSLKVWVWEPLRPWLWWPFMCMHLSPHLFKPVTTGKLDNIAMTCLITIRKAHACQLEQAYESLPSKLLESVRNPKWFWNLSNTPTTVPCRSKHVLILESSSYWESPPQSLYGDSRVWFREARHKTNDQNQKN